MVLMSWNDAHAMRTADDRVVYGNSTAFALASRERRRGDEGGTLDTLASTRNDVADRGAVHPVVRLNRIVRVFGCPMAAVVVGSTRLDEPTPPGIWVALVAYAFVWPQVAYWLVAIERATRNAPRIFA